MRGIRIARRRSSGRPARGMDWVGARLSTTNAIVPNNKAILDIFPPAEVRAFGVDPTLVRTRGWFYAVPGSTLPAGSNNIVEVGIIAVSGQDPDDAASLTAVDSTDLNADWIWHASVYHNGGTTDNILRCDREIDSRAMRRLGNNSGLVMVVQNDASSQTNIDFWFHLRMLFKE